MPAAITVAAQSCQLSLLVTWLGYLLYEMTFQIHKVEKECVIVEWNTLLTVLMQTQAINTKVVGPDRKTVISLDMGLYQPAKKLQMQ